MFPLKQRQVGGYSFGQKTWYSARHLGTDYRAAKGTPVYAPFDGTVVSQTRGVQGGNTVLFKPAGQDVVIRFMHLDRFATGGGKVRKGDVIAYTGNTGALTAAPHLHVDISRHALNLGDFWNFVDPERFDWR
jgi:murein DD-endopeptidase MepM/ murein hydrolase activator NlpD